MKVHGSFPPQSQRQLILVDQGCTLSEIEKTIRKLSRRANRSRTFSIESVPAGLNMQDELKLVSNRARLLSCLFNGDIKWINRKRGELVQELIDRGFDPIPIPMPVATGEDEDDEGSAAEEATGYEYLTRIPVCSFDEDALQDLLKRKAELEEIMRSATPLYRGLTGLKISEKESTMVDANYEEGQLGSEIWKDVFAKDNKVFEATPRRQHKRAATESLEDEMLEIYEKLLKQIDNGARFLSDVLSGDINCINGKKSELRQELMEKGFDPLPKEENAERPDVDAKINSQVSGAAPRRQHKRTATECLESCPRSLQEIIHCTFLLVQPALLLIKHIFHGIQSLSCSDIIECGVGRTLKDSSSSSVAVYFLGFTPGQSDVIHELLQNFDECHLLTS